MNMTKKEQRLYNKYVKEAQFLYPEHKKNKNNAKRKDFISQLLKSPDFVETCVNNDKKLADSIKETIKKFGVRHYIMISLIAAAFGTTGYMINQDRTSNTQKTIKQLSTDVLSIILAALLGFVVGGGMIAPIKQANTDMSVDKFYNRMAVRLFYEMKRFHKDLDEKTLQLCNPELARVVKALLVANMPIKQTLELKSIALKTAEHIYTPSYVGEISDIRVREDELNRAIMIVDNCLFNNPGLKEAILNVFKGNIPAKFIIDENNQNIK